MMTSPTIFARAATTNEVTLAGYFEERARLESALYRGNMDFVPTSSQDTMIHIVGGAGESVFGLLRAYEVSHEAWFIDLLHVVTEARGIGIGSAMLASAIKTVKNHGGKRLHSAALPGDRSTKNLFERHGLVAQMITVGKNID
jgi:GNAT superfamily N-acetyltransferase